MIWVDGCAEQRVMAEASANKLRDRADQRSFAEPDSSC